MTSAHPVDRVHEVVAGNRCPGHHAAARNCLIWG
jgi:hypothetical protein